MAKRLLNGQQEEAGARLASFAHEYGPAQFSRRPKPAHAQRFGARHGDAHPPPFGLFGNRGFASRQSRAVIIWRLYDENGKVDEDVVLDANGDVRCINVEKGRWHSLECLESGSVLLESKDGAYAPLGEEDVMG